MNSGKRFEANFKASVPPNVFCYRLRDGTGAWDEGKKTRFQSKNMCDYILFDGHELVLAELKSHKGKSLPLTAIRGNQVEQLKAATKFENVIPLLIVYFEDTQECFYLGATALAEFIEKGERKSIPIEYFVSRGVKIPTRKKKVNTTHDLRVLFGELDPAWSFDWRLP